MKKQIIALLSITPVLVLAGLFFSDSYKNLQKKTDTIQVPNTEKNTASSSGVNWVSSAANLTCPDGLVMTTIVKVDGSEIKSCDPANSFYVHYLVGDGSQTYQIEGYYTTYAVQAYRFNVEDEEHRYTIVCPAFTITSGSQEFVDAYRKLVQEGNTVNRIDEKGNLVLNISFEDLSEEMGAHIVGSNANSPIGLLIRAKALSERDANYCESMIQLQSAFHLSKYSNSTYDF